MFYKTEHLNSIEKLEELGFEGVDVSLEISLFEYDMVWKKLDNGEWLFVHRLLGEWGDVFDSTYLLESDLDLDDKTIASICSFVGMTKDEWMETSFPNKVFDTSSCLSLENVFGDSYGGGFEVDRG